MTLYKYSLPTTTTSYADPICNLNNYPVTIPAYMGLFGRNLLVNYYPIHVEPCPRSASLIEFLNSLAACLAAMAYPSGFDEAYKI